jgi:hypothetical protein
MCEFSISDHNTVVVTLTLTSHFLFFVCVCVCFVGHEQSVKSIQEVEWQHLLVCRPEFARLSM